MKIAAGCNHRGSRAKAAICSVLQRLGHEVCDFSCSDREQIDYPEIASRVGNAVSDRECDIGILMSGHGIGMCLAANKVPGVRAAVAYDGFIARTAREQFHCNVICLAVDFCGEKDLQRLIIEFLTAVPGDGRHARQARKIAHMEQQNFGPRGQYHDYDLIPFVPSVASSRLHPEGALPSPY